MNNKAGRQRKQFLEEQLLELKGQACSRLLFWRLHRMFFEALRRRGRSKPERQQDCSRPSSLSLMLRPGHLSSSCLLATILWQYLLLFSCCFFLFSKETNKWRGRRRASHGALLPGVGHNRESPAWPKHPLWWQSVAKFINNWGQVFTSVFVFPAGPEGYSALYETNGCRLDARGLWAFCALMG